MTLFESIVFASTAVALLNYSVNYFLAIVFLLIAYFLVSLVIETIANDTNVHKPRTLPTRLVADIFECILNIYNAIVGNHGNTSSEHGVAHCEEMPSLDAEIRTFSKHITKDYIRIWYDMVSDNEEFIEESEIAFQEILRRLFVDQLSDLDPRKVCSIALLNLKDALQFDQIPNHFENEHEYALFFIEKVLSSIQPSTLQHIAKRKISTLNGSSEDPIYVLIRQLLVEGALIPLLSLITNPEWINWAVIQLFSESKELECCNDSMRQKLVESIIDGTRETNSESRSAPVSPLSDRKNVQATITRSQSLNYPPGFISERFVARKNSLNSAQSESEMNFENVVLEGDEINELKIFTNISIPRTEEVRVNHEHFVVYWIQYDALFEEIHGKEQLKNENETVSSTLVKKQMHVKRRFREFLILQSRLEENSRLRSYLKDMRKPTKLKRETQNLLNIALGNFKLDDATLEYRRRYLENYLTELVNCDAIANSLELHQFLGYSLDCRNAYERAKPILMPVHLDKMLTRSIKGAMNLIKVALPVEPQEGTFASQTIEPFARKVTHHAVKLDYSDNLKLERYFHISDTDYFVNIIHGGDSNDESTQKNSFFEELSFLGPRLRGDGCEENSNEEKSAFNINYCFEKEIPVGNNLIDIGVTLFLNKSSNNSISIIIFKAFFGQIFE
ncbi:sorting nexin-19-like protein, partial [Dinothrombium tinctorium]